MPFMGCVFAFSFSGEFALSLSGCDLSDSLEELPQPTRTYEGLIGLMPKFAPPNAFSGVTNNPMQSMQIQANGTSGSGTDVRIEGISAQNPFVQYYSTDVPSTDAILADDCRVIEAHR
jgi:hypothetical protein